MLLYTTEGDIVSPKKYSPIYPLTPTRGAKRVPLGRDQYFLSSTLLHATMSSLPLLYGFLFIFTDHFLSLPLSPLSSSTLGDRAQGILQSTGRHCDLSYISLFPSYSSIYYLFLRQGLAGWSNDLALIILYLLASIFQ